MNRLKHNVAIDGFAFTNIALRRPAPMGTGAQGADQCNGAGPSNSVELDDVEPLLCGF